MPALFGRLSAFYQSMYELTLNSTINLIRSFFTHHVAPIAFAVSGPIVLSIYSCAILCLTANLSFTKSFPWSTGPLSNWIVWLGLGLLFHLIVSNARAGTGWIGNWNMNMWSTRFGGKLLARVRATHLTRHSYALRSLLILIAALLTTISKSDARASESAEVVAIAPAALTFARYFAFLDKRDVFSESGPVLVEISASLPEQDRHAYFTAVRSTGESERSQYDVLQIEGDPTLVEVIVGRYLSVKAQLDELPPSAVLITPANYKFRYLGSRYRFGTLAEVFQITPRKSRIGLIKGQLWIDPETGVPLRQTGRFIKAPSDFLRRTAITSNVDLHNGVPYERITQAIVDMPHPIGRAELMITERPLQQVSGQIASAER